MSVIVKENILTFPLTTHGSNHIWHIVDQYSSGNLLFRCKLCLVEASGSYVLNDNQSGLDFIIDTGHSEMDARDCNEYTSRLRSLILSHSFEVNQYNKNYKNCKACGILGYNQLKNLLDKEPFKNSPLYGLDITHFNDEYVNEEQWSFAMQAFSMTCEEIQIAKILK